MSKSEEDVVKTTVRLGRSLWKQARVRALDEGRDFQDIVADALEMYLKSVAKRREAR